MLSCTIRGVHISTSIDSSIRMFSTLFETASKIKGKISQEIGDRCLLPESYGVLWEPSENVEKCRSCQSKFQLPLLKRKHHCRVCAGVFCDSCCMLPPDSNGMMSVSAAIVNLGTKSINPNQEIDDRPSGMRVCDGCKRGETPGEGLRKVMRKQIEKAVEQESSRLARRESKNTVPAEETAAKALHRLSMIVAVRVGETVGVQFADVHPSESIKLSRGSAYGEDKHTVQTSKPIPKIGYFEMINKSKEFFCVKVLRKGGDQRFEVPRPSYIAVPPGGSVYAFFNEDEDEDVEQNDLEIIILYNNLNAVPVDLSTVFYDTTLIVNTTKVSPCAKVELFKSVIFYSVVSKASNVLLKYKGNGVLNARVGNSVQRVGVLGALQGNQHAKDKIDFGTNVKQVTTVFSAYS